MPQSATVTVNNKNIMVRELILQEIHDLSAAGVSGVDAVHKLLATCTDADPEFIMSLAPSDLSPLIEKMLEVNSPFSDQAAKIGMEGAAEGLQRLIRSIFMMPFLQSSAPDTENEPGNTPTQSSSEP